MKEHEQDAKLDVVKINSFPSKASITPYKHANHIQLASEDPNLTPYIGFEFALARIARASTH
jgi:hypothetical protein